MAISYRKDIDGLRAIAVLSVIFYHAKFPGFGGGYLGVDIFFVISGYLISSIIMNDLSQNNFLFSVFMNDVLEEYCLLYLPQLYYPYRLLGFINASRF